MYIAGFNRTINTMFQSNQEIQDLPMQVPPLVYHLKAIRSVSQELRYQIPVFPRLNKGFLKKQWYASRPLKNKEYFTGFGVDCKPIKSNRSYGRVCESGNAACQLIDNIALAAILLIRMFLELIVPRVWIVPSLDLPVSKPASRQRGYLHYGVCGVLPLVEYATTQRGWLRYVQYCLLHPSS